MLMGASGFSLSRNSSWAQMSDAMLSSTPPFTKMMRSRSIRLKMSKLRSPRLVSSMTTGTRPLWGSFKILFLSVMDGVSPSVTGMDI